MKDATYVKNIPQWYLVSTIFIFIIIYFVDVIDPYIQFSKNFIFALLYSFFGFFVYMIFHIVFVIIYHKTMGKRGILLACLAIISLLVPFVTGLVGLNLKRELSSYFIFYSMPIITIIFASYIFIRQKKRLLNGNRNARITKNL